MKKPSDMERIKQVYANLQDEQSRLIWRSRFLAALTGDDRYLARMVNELYSLWPEYQPFGECLKFAGRHKDKKIAVFGAGKNGIMLQEFLLCNKIKVSSFVDNNPDKTEWGGAPVITPLELLENKDEYCVLNPIEIDADDAIRTQLADMGFDVSCYCRVFPILEKQYFPDGIIVPSENEIFIDGGSLDLADTYKFAKWCSNHYEKVYAFEPDKRNYAKCEKNRRDDRISIVKAGLWSESGELNFESTGWGDAAVSETGVDCVKTVAIDELLGEQAVTFIKMDIEGAELEALHGAKRMIQRERPKLAICIYHKEEDLVEIPEYIMQLVPEYKFYIRHYTMFRCETVLYAVA